MLRICDFFFCHSSLAPSQRNSSAFNTCDQLEVTQIIQNNLPNLRSVIWNISVKFIFSCKLISEKAMAPHSSTLAWKIPWTEEPDWLQSMGSLRVRHGWATSLSLFTFMHWRRKWQSTPVSLPGESQGPGSRVGCCLWSCTESDTTEAT